ncbi:MAG: response regulator [bacterium]
MNKKILIIDDEEIILTNLTQALQENGFSVDPALSGEEALRKMKDTSYDLVITDLKLGEKSGLDVLDELRRENPDTPGVMMTAYGSPEVAAEVDKIGGVEYIEKPFELEEMADIVHRLLKKEPAEVTPAEAPGVPPWTVLRDRTARNTRSAVKTMTNVSVKKAVHASSGIILIFKGTGRMTRRMQSVIRAPVHGMKKVVRRGAEKPGEKKDGKIERQLADEIRALGSEMKRMEMEIVSIRKKATQKG